MYVYMYVCLVCTKWFIEELPLLKRGHWGIKSKESWIYVIKPAKNDDG